MGHFHTGHKHCPEHRLNYMVLHCLFLEYVSYVRDSKHSWPLTTDRLFEWRKLRSRKANRHVDRHGCRYGMAYFPLVLKAICKKERSIHGNVLYEVILQRRGGGLWRSKVCVSFDSGLSVEPRLTSVDAVDKPCGGSPVAITLSVLPKPWPEAGMCVVV